jgi:hypothetical protein
MEYALEYEKIPITYGKEVTQVAPYLNRMELDKKWSRDFIGCNACLKKFS